jgi:hypothetical protein
MSPPGSIDKDGRRRISLNPESTRRPPILDRAAPYFTATF